MCPKDTDVPAISDRQIGSLTKATLNACCHFMLAHKKPDKHTSLARSAFYAKSIKNFVFWSNMEK